MSLQSVPPLLQVTLFPEAFRSVPPLPPVTLFPEAFRSVPLLLPVPESESLSVPVPESSHCYYFRRSLLQTSWTAAGSPLLSWQQDL